MYKKDKELIEIAEKNLELMKEYTELLNDINKINEILEEE